MMKALILAAGLGTRLRPYTDHTPKPLFPINGQALIDRLIHQLKSAGCEAVAVNTHYLHQKVEAHIEARSYGIPVVVRYEPDILGTGGAIRNFSDFWDDRPFLVINADIFTDIDFREIYRYHIANGVPATMVLVDSPGLNSVTIDSNNFVTGFLSPSAPSRVGTYTFTGIQVIDPTVLPLIPEHIFFSSIDAYRRLIADGSPPAAYIVENRQWQDLGTPERYTAASRDAVATAAFQKVFGALPHGTAKWRLLDGDGSDRQWYRVQFGDRSLVAADHGLKKKPGFSEVDAFISIGKHLSRCGVPVPEIHAHDRFSGWVIMEDVGDLHLQTAVKEAISPEAAASLYRAVLDILVRFSQEGIRGFDTAWTCQSAAYDRPLILERECRYFVDAFLCGYLGLQVDTDTLMPVFHSLAEGALAGGVSGLMHRDFQSRNIMINAGTPRIIDFQGARRGPIQYDMASLLIDPYTELSESLQESLYTYAVDALSRETVIDPASFRRCYECCRITRNLQALGAFGYLTRVKGKKQFENYIPVAMDSLKRNLARIALPGVSMLRKVVDEIRLIPRQP